MLGHCWKRKLGEHCQIGRENKGPTRNARGPRLAIPLALLALPKGSLRLRLRNYGPSRDINSFEHI